MEINFKVAIRLKATLILANGMVFQGESIGSGSDRVVELALNTSMVGYQEILTDPAYAGQGVVMTYPLVGNYGVNSIDNESRAAWAGAFVVRHLSPRGSNFRCEGTLDAYLKEHDIVGIQGVDTRAITRILRNQGTMNGMITCAEHFNVNEVMEKLNSYKVEGQVERVTRTEVEVIPAVGEQKYRVAVLDLGVRNSMLAILAGRGCEVTVYPASTPAQTVLDGKYDGVILSDGPGDPADNTGIIAEVAKLYAAEVPVMASGLGHQILALAAGCRISKMKFGHNGTNQPVRDVALNRCFITHQNHGYVVDADSVPADVAAVSHVNVNDGTVEGLVYNRANCFSVQFDPAADLGAEHEYLYNRFISNMGGDR